MDKSTVRVLLIEDNPGDARIICEMLASSEAAQFEVEVAARLSEGLDLLESRGSDVLLLDLSLPDSSEADTLSKARARAGAVPIIVFTGYDDTQKILKTIRGGARDYFVKDRLDGKLLVEAILREVCT